MAALGFRRGRPFLLHKSYTKTHFKGIFWAENVYFIQKRGNKQINLCLFVMESPYGPGCHAVHRARGLGRKVSIPDSFSCSSPISAVHRHLCSVGCVVLSFPARFRLYRSDLTLFALRRSGEPAPGKFFMLKIILIALRYFPLTNLPLAPSVRPGGAM